MDCFLHVYYMYMGKQIRHIHVPGDLGNYFAQTCQVQLIPVSNTNRNEPHFSFNAFPSEVSFLHQGIYHFIFYVSFSNSLFTIKANGTM